ALAGRVGGQRCPTQRLRGDHQLASGRVRRPRPAVGDPQPRRRDRGEAPPRLGQLRRLQQDYPEGRHRTRAHGKLDSPLEKDMLLAVWVPRHLACRHRCGKSRCRKRDGRHCAEPRGKQVEALIYLATLGKTPLWRVATYAEPGRLPDRSAVELPDPTSVPEPVAGYPMVRVLGRLHWNGATFPPGGDRKHDERMVVEKVLEGPARVQHEERLLTAENVAAWEAVIDSYHRAREHDRTPLTNYGDYIADPKRWRTLLPGDTLHVEFGDDDQIIGLYPAMVGRKPFPGPPRVSLPATHRPAESLSELSPADRVFGWVRQGA